MNPAESLLVRLVRGEAKDLRATEADWQAVTGCAARLGLVGRLAMRAEALREAGVPDEWLATWSRGLRDQAAFNLLLAQAETELLNALAGRGIEAIPLKGVSLSRILYGSAAARSVTDIDLLVRAGQAAPAAELLEARGFRSSLPRKLLSERAFLHDADEHTAETVYVSKKGGVPIQAELHWKILPLAEDAVWDSLVEYDGAGQMVRDLSPALYLLYLCAHLSGHGWQSLHWLSDLAEFLQQFGARIDASKFLHHTARARLRHRVGVTLALVEAYFGFDWKPGEDLLDPRALRTAAAMLRRPLEPMSFPSVLAAHRERLRLQDGAAGRIRYLWWLAHPTREEWVRADGALRPAPAAWATRAARLLRFAAAGLRGATREEGGAPTVKTKGAA